jgi:hypothetical protein
LSGQHRKKILKTGEKRLSDKNIIYSSKMVNLERYRWPIVDFLKSFRGSGRPASGPPKGTGYTGRNLIYEVIQKIFLRGSAFLLQGPGNGL